MLDAAKKASLLLACPWVLYKYILKPPVFTPLWDFELQIGYQPTYLYPLFLLNTSNTMRSFYRASSWNQCNPEPVTKFRIASQHVSPYSSGQQSIKLFSITQACSFPHDMSGKFGCRDVKQANIKFTYVCRLVSHFKIAPYKELTWLVAGNKHPF